MARILFLIILFWLLFQVIKRFIASTNQAPTDTKTKSDEKIVQCSQCGLHVPENESHIKNDLIICNNPSCADLEAQKKQNGD
jgi:hypothetical protein